MKEQLNLLNIPIVHYIGFSKKLSVITHERMEALPPPLSAIFAVPQTWEHFPSVRTFKKSEKHQEHLLNNAENFEMQLKKAPK